MFVWDLKFSDGEPTSDVDLNQCSWTCRALTGVNARNLGILLLFGPEVLGGWYCLDNCRFSASLGILIADLAFAC